MTKDQNIDLSSELDNLPYEFLFATVSGAHLYGFPSPDSDIDLRAVHILSLREIAGLELITDVIDATHKSNGIEVDIVSYDVHKFFKMLLKKNGSVLEQLYSPLVIRTSPWHEELKEIATDYITKNHFHHYVGFAQTKWQEFKVKRSVKSLVYAYRALLSGIHLMQTGLVMAHLPTLVGYYDRPFVELALKAKLEGKECDRCDLSLDVLEKEYYSLLELLHSSVEKSDLPEVYDSLDPLNDLLLRIRLGELNNE